MSSHTRIISVILTYSFRSLRVARTIDGGGEALSSAEDQLYMF